jgi:hypothetical protein
MKQKQGILSQLGHGAKIANLRPPQPKFFALIAARLASYEEHLAAIADSVANCCIREARYLLHFPEFSALTLQFNR